MANIDIRHRHSLSLPAARAQVAELTAAIATRYQLQRNWQDNTLFFQRSGLTGRIDVGHDEIRVRVELGLMLAMLKPAIEREIEREIASRFS